MAVLWPQVTDLGHVSKRFASIVAATGSLKLTPPGYLSDFVAMAKMRETMLVEHQTLLASRLEKTAETSMGLIGPLTFVFCMGVVNLVCFFI